MTESLPPSPHPLPDGVTPEAVLGGITRLAPDGRYLRLMLKAWGAGEFRWEDLSAGPLSPVGQTIRDLVKLDPPKAFLKSVPSLSEARRFVAANLKPEAADDLSPSARQDLLLDRAKARLESWSMTLPSGLEITVPLTQFASIFRGQGTKWCTSAWFDNAFAHYAEDTTLLILKTPDERLFQTDLTGFASGQTLMNAQDGTPDLEEWRALRPHLPGLVAFVDAARPQCENDDEQADDRHAVFAQWLDGLDASLAQPEVNRTTSTNVMAGAVPEAVATRATPDRAVPERARSADTVRLEEIARSRRQSPSAGAAMERDPYRAVQAIARHLPHLLQSGTPLAIEGLLGGVPYNIPTIKAIVQAATRKVSASPLWSDIFREIAASFQAGGMKSLPPPAMDGDLARQVAHYVVGIAFSRTVLASGQVHKALPMVKALDSWVQAAGAERGTDRRLDALMQDYALLAAGLDRKTLRRLPRDERLAFEMFSTMRPDGGGIWSEPENRREAVVYFNDDVAHAADMPHAETMMRKAVASLSAAIPFPSAEDIAILEHLAASWIDGTLTREDALSVTTYVEERSATQNSTTQAMTQARMLSGVLSPRHDEDVPFLLPEQDGSDLDDEDLDRDDDDEPDGLQRGRLSGKGYLVDLTCNTNAIFDTAQHFGYRIWDARDHIKDAFQTPYEAKWRQDRPTPSPGG